MESKEFAGNSLLDGWDGVLLEGRYEPDDKISLTLVVCCDRYMMTVALPLSAVRILMESLKRLFFLISFLNHSVEKITRINFALLLIFGQKKLF